MNLTRWLAWHWYGLRNMQKYYRSSEKGFICHKSFKKPTNRQMFALIGENGDMEARMSHISKINTC